MDLRFTREAAGLLIHVGDPEFNGTMASEFKDRVRAEIQAETDVILDMGDVQFVDSSAMGALLAVARDTREKGGEFVIATQAEQVLIAFQLIRLQKTIQVVPSVEEAREELAR